MHAALFYTGEPAGEITNFTIALHQAGRMLCKEVRPHETSARSCVELLDIPAGFYRVLYVWIFIVRCSIHE